MVGKFGEVVFRAEGEEEVGPVGAPCPADFFEGFVQEAAGLRAAREGVGVGGVFRRAGVLCFVIKFEVEAVVDGEVVRAGLSPDTSTNPFWRCHD